MRKQGQILYKVRYCSSEDQAYPASNLLNCSIECAGWQSARFHSFPQTLILQFRSPVRIHQLQVLSHESKIASKLELFTSSPREPVPPLEYLDWSPLGSMEFERNEHSFHKARELKSAFIDVETLFLRLKLDKCHFNELNPFGQVGLICINVLGDEQGAYRLPKLTGVLSVKNERPIDSNTAEKVKELMMLKEQAVANEDFDRAKELKGIIERLKSMSYQLLHLESEKTKAVLGDNFDHAKVLKNEIHRLKKAVNPVILEPILEEQSPAKQKSLGARRPKMSNNSYIFDEDSEAAAKQSTASKNWMIPLLGHELCDQLQSKNWHYREDALSLLERKLNDPSGIDAALEGDELFLAILEATKHLITDKVLQVVLRNLALITTLTEFEINHPTRGDVTDTMKAVATLILDKTGDNNPRVREAAEGAYIAICNHETFGPLAAVQQLIKLSREKSTKHHTARLILLNQLVKEFSIDNSRVPLDPVMSFALTGFKHTNAEVRSAAYPLLVTIYSHIGNRIHGLLEDIRPQQLELLLKGFGEVDEGLYSEPQRIHSKPLPVPLCPYCGHKDLVFANEDTLDLHYWKDCPMLLSCPTCSQIVEIKHLNTHLLGECEISEVMKQCTRCNEAVHMEEYEQHIEEQACNPAVSIKEANRCPLCHQDTSAGIEGWKEHILAQGCPNNDRSNFQ